VTDTDALDRIIDRCFRVLVFLLPLHTVYLDAWVAWKPWLILLVLVAAMSLLTGRGWPWNAQASAALAVFVGAVLVSWPGTAAPPTFWRLVLALAAGGLLFLVTARRAVDIESLLRVVFWSGAAMAATGLIFGLITNGVFGAPLVEAINDLPGVDRVNKIAYVEGFVALTNWHQDPGYSALWTNVWFVLAGQAWLRGIVTGPRWLGALVLGGLASATVLTLSRTGWIGLLVAVAALSLSRRGDWRRTAKVLGGAALAATLILTGMFLSDPEGVGNDMETSVLFRLVNLVVLGQIEVDEEDVVPGLDPGDNRLEVWPLYWERFVGSPVRGTGLGTGWAEQGTQEPHNLWLQLAAETGLLGLLGFGVVLGACWRLAGRPGEVVTPALAVVGVATLTQTVLFEPVLWFVLGLWAARTKSTRRSHHGQHDEVPDQDESVVDR